jgi:ADP-heptose:LPS heptosyltransferase
MTIRTDCRHYRVSVPCRPHKQTQVRCEDCLEHAPIEQRILVVKLDAMGDVLRTTTCLEPLKRLYPRSHVTWITRKEAVTLLEGNPSIDCILPVESNYLEFLLSEDFDLAFGPDADLLSATIMRLARAETKRGFMSDRRGGIIPLNDAAEKWWRMGVDDSAKRENRRTYGEWLYAICELPAPVARPWLRPGAEARSRFEQFLRRCAPGATRRVCFNTGASRRWEEKRWKAHYYRDLAALIRERDPATAIVLVGGPAEAEFNAELLASGAGFIDAGTNNPVEGFAALIASCDWLLTPDSLGYHVACAVGTPAVCVAGPTSPWELDLYGTNQVVHADLDCIACYLARCPFATTCMDALTPRAIWPRLPYADSSPPAAVVPVAGRGRPNPTIALRIAAASGAH